MNAYTLEQTKSPLTLQSRDDLKPAAGEVVVDLRAAALNRRDYWITQGKYPGIKYPIVLGSDGAGVVVQAGTGVENIWADAEVIINPGWYWGANRFAQSNEFQILGLPHDGTLAEQVVVPAEYIHFKPKHLTTVQAAALPLAGLTAFRALFTRGQLQTGETVLITGSGGGVATFALQFALAAGAKVFVTSSSPQKIDAAIKIGATAGFDYTQSDWQAQVKYEVGMVDVAIDGAGGNGYSSLVEFAAPGGRIVNYGATAGHPEKVDVNKIYWKQLNLLGSTMGSPADFRAMLAFVDEHKIEPVVDRVFPLAEVNAAIEHMANTEQFGKIVLEI